MFGSDRLPLRPTSYTYDTEGRVETVTDSDGYTVTYEYDDLDRIKKVVYPDTTFEETVYEKLDAVATRDRLGRWTRVFYDPLRRMVSSRDPLGRIVTQEWCRCGELDAISDPKGNRTEWVRDLQGRVVTEVRANGSEWVYAYETKTSRLKSITDPKGQTKTYGYDLDDNLTSTTYTNEEHPTPDVTFTYDDVYNRIETMADGTGPTSYEYYPIDPTPVLGAGKLKDVNGPLANDKITYGYDELGRVVSRTIDGVALTYEYDALGRIDEEANALGTFTFGYDGVTSRLLLVTYPNSQTTEYAYYGNQEDHRLLEIHHKKPDASTLSKFGYVYDDVGNILEWTQQTDSDPAKMYAFDYDPADQLRTATWQTTDPAPTVLKRYRYGYDAAGNRTVEQIDDQTTLTSHDNMNWLVQQVPGGTLRFAGSLDEQALVTINSLPADVTADNRFSLDVPVTPATTEVTIQAMDYSDNTAEETYQLGSLSGSTTSFQFDGNGNMTSDGTRTFEWDAENRVLAIEQGSLRSEFSYDGKSRRISIVEQSGQTVTSDRRLLWCGTILCEEKGSGGGAATKRYFRQGVEQSTLAYFYSLDHLSSVRELTDAVGTLKARYGYGVYGKRTLLSGEPLSDVGFTGHYEHAQSGLTLALYRVYDAAVGRWLSEDPAGLDIDINRYSYAFGGPAMNIDPDGAVSIRTPPIRMTYFPPNMIWTECLKGGGTGSGACLLSDGKVDCGCSQGPCGGGYQPQVNITIRWTILYTDGYADIGLGRLVSSAELLAHERLHLEGMRAALEGPVRTRAEELEREVFPNKADCEAACDDFEKWAFGKINRGRRTHSWMERIMGTISDAIR